MKQERTTSIYPIIYQIVLLVTLLLAVTLRFSKLDAQSLWNDEGNTARLVERPINLILSGAAGDVHPPGYYLILRVWRAFTGETEFALRSYSALCGVLTVALTVAISKDLIKQWNYKVWALGLPTLSFITLHPLSVYYSQEVRMYAQLGMVTASLLWASIKYQKLITQSTPAILNRQRNISLFLLACIVALGLYTHYAFIFAIVSLNCAYGLYWLINDFKNWRILLAWLGPFVLGGLVFIPWMPVALRVSGWNPPDLGAASAIQSLARALVVGVTLPDFEAVYILPGIIIFGCLLIFRLPCASFVTWATFAMAFFPLIMMVGFGIFRPAYVKFLIISICPLAVCFTALLNEWAVFVKNRYIRFVIVVCLLVVFTPAQIRALLHLYHNPVFARDDYRGIVNFIEMQARNGDAVLLNAPNQWEVFTYYYHGNLPIYTAPYRPTSRAAAIWVENIVNKHPQLFVLYWGETEADPGRLIEIELAQQAYIVEQRWMSSVRFVRYGTAIDTLSSRNLSDVVLGSGISLKEYFMPDVSLHPGDILPLTLVWSVNSKPIERYKVFIHMVDDAGTLIAQTDAEPVGGFHLTSQWSVGEVIRDNHGVLLPETVMPGQYRIMVGLYNFSGQRLPVTRKSQLDGDSVILDSVIVEPQQ